MQLAFISAASFNPTEHLNKAEVLESFPAGKIIDLVRNVINYS
jgi:hypothetical protein